jgi:calcineurin-like phosphoesterase family protein
MTYFTSDHHFGDTRFNLFHRDFKSSIQQEYVFMDAWNSTVEPSDTVYHLGDFAYDDESLDIVNKLNGTIHLIKGNYDDPRPQDRLLELFESVQDNLVLNIGGEEVYLVHYPERGRPDMFNIVGHIHGLWKVQRNMINVGCDAWHYRPVSEERIKFTMEAIRKHYDVNVFAGELECNNIL